jgi:hypothetical protein
MRHYRVKRQLELPILSTRAFIFKLACDLVLGVETRSCEGHREFPHQPHHGLVCEFFPVDRAEIPLPEDTARSISHLAGFRSRFLLLGPAGELVSRGSLGSASDTANIGDCHRYLEAAVIQSKPERGRLQETGDPV